MKPEVLVLYPQRPKAMAQLEATYTLHRYDEASDKEAFLAEHGANCRTIVTNGHAPITQAILDAMPNLDLVACSSAGFDEFDVVAMAKRGIKLTNSSPALCDDVADLAILLMMAARRGMVKGDAWVRTGTWGREGMMPLTRSTSGKTLGIVGMGTIGQAIAHRAEAMGMKVAYWNRRAKDVPYTYVADLHDLARQADTLIAIVAGGEGTRGLISESVMEALGPDGLLVNVARGTVVDEPAMIACLTDGRLGHAALDVYENEPNPDPRLVALTNTTFYPHHASGTVETRDAMAQTVVDNLAAYYAGHPLLTAVDLSGYLPQPVEA